MPKDWLEEYKRKTILAEEAAKLVKSGDVVTFARGREALAIGLAIAARKEELKNVTINVQVPAYDFGWYDPGWEESFNVVVGLPTPMVEEAVYAGRCDRRLNVLYPGSGLEGTQRTDILLIEVSPPDERGFCSFGNSVWDKKHLIREAKLVIAEVNKNLIRTYGDNFVHISEIHYFVEHIASGRSFATGSLAGRPLKEPEPYLKDIAGYLSETIRDRDTIQIGVGRTTEPIVRFGAFNNKHDLGYHSEVTAPGIIALVRDGVFTGKYKTLNPGKVVATTLGGGTKEEMDWASNNPLFWLMDIRYIEDIRVISAHDNMVAINSALSMDLLGRINAETVGARYLAGGGGQLVFVIGALMSKGGRAITVLPSTAANGTASRIMAQFPAGAGTTIHPYCADIVVTEYGIARLRSKTLRQRARELIAIAHPDFRAELRKAARELYGV